MKIGFLGYGEAAYNIASGLKENGDFDVKAYDVMQNDEKFGQLIKWRAEKSGCILVGSPREAVENVDLLFAAVPSSNALEICRNIVPNLKKNIIYVDVSASTPNTKQMIWNEIKDKEVLFVDAAMMGSLPQNRHTVPIYASGNGAQAFCNLMSPFGMRITVIGDEAGAASAIKLIRSIYMKGIAALMIEMLEAANAYNVSDKVISSIGKSMDGISFSEHLNRLVTGTAVHAYRRGKELEGSIQLLKECRLNSDMTEASKKIHEYLADKDFSFMQKTEEDITWKQVVNFLETYRMEN